MIAAARYGLLKSYWLLMAEQQAGEMKTDMNTSVETPSAAHR
jgi:hypothetical protein